MQGAAPSINLLRLECEPLLPPGYLIQLVWPLTAQATCLWRSSERSTWSRHRPIYKFTPDGARTTFASGLFEPQGLAFDRAGNLFVAAGGTVLKFTPNGVRTAFAFGLTTHLLWPLIAGAICLWRMAATRGLPPSAWCESINLPRPGCEAPLSRICQAVWLLTARTICLSGSLAAFLRLVRAGYEPPLPPDQLELWLSSETLRQTLRQTLRRLTLTTTVTQITCSSTQRPARHGSGT